jgi:hypothetical protein
MNKKMVIMSLLAVFMLVSISFVSSAEVNSGVEKKESPLFKLRTRRVISEKIGNIIENIQTKFLGGRILFLPFQGITDDDQISIMPGITIAKAYFWCHGPPTIIRCIP